MTAVVCHADPSGLPRSRPTEDVHVVLYGEGAMPPGVARIGSRLMDPVSRLGLGIREDAFDFLTLALAVTAADTFVLREEADDRWCRRISLDVPLIDPGPWREVRVQLQKALGFLSGDEWDLILRPGGPRPPGRSVREARRNQIDLSGADCASLLSGGLDSFIGALDLSAEGRSPLYVTHAYRGDQRYQRQVMGNLNAGAPCFAANAHPTRSAGNTDVSMRTRSFNFLAYGAVAATAIAQRRGVDRVDLIVPENGPIALNPPLTPRRIGSHSTRTTHPAYLSAIQGIMDGVGLPVRISNPLRHQTKGEMMARYADDPTFPAAAVETVSCGKWKRKNQQCGHCVPCLIRRAAFHAAGIPDVTQYRVHGGNLVRVMGDRTERDDLASMLRAVRRSRDAAMEPWVIQAGPLPDDPAERAACVDVFARGMVEMGRFLRANGFP